MIREYYSFENVNRRDFLVIAHPDAWTRGVAEVTIAEFVENSAGENVKVILHPSFIPALAKKWSIVFHSKDKAKAEKFGEDLKADFQYRYNATARGKSDYQVLGEDAFKKAVYYVRRKHREIEPVVKTDYGVGFDSVISALKAGGTAWRSGWNGKGMYIFLVPGSKFKVNREPLLGIMGEGTEVTYNAHIDIRTADGSVAVWNPSQVDMIAEDWTTKIVEKNSF